MDEKEYLESKLEDDEVIKSRKKHIQLVLMLIITILFISLLATICIVSRNTYIIIFTIIISIFLGIMDLKIYLEIYESILNYAHNIFSKDLNMFLTNQPIENKDDISELEEVYSEKLYDFEKLALYKEHVVIKEINFLSKYIKNLEKEITLFYEEVRETSYMSQTGFTSNYYYLFQKSNKKINTFLKINPHSIEYLNKEIAKMLEEYKDIENKDIVFGELDNEVTQKLLETSKKYDVDFKLYIKDGEVLLIMYFHNYRPLNIKLAIKKNYNLINATKEILNILDCLDKKNM